MLFTVEPLPQTYQELNNCSQPSGYQLVAVYKVDYSFLHLFPHLARVWLATHSNRKTAMGKLPSSDIKWTILQVLKYSLSLMQVAKMSTVWKIIQNTGLDAKRDVSIHGVMPLGTAASFLRNEDNN